MISIIKEVKSINNIFFLQNQKNIISGQYIWYISLNYMWKKVIYD